MEQPSNDNTPDHQSANAPLGFDHALVFGDNLDALKRLKESRLDKVKSVYIDPLGCHFCTHEQE